MELIRAEAVTVRRGGRALLDSVNLGLAAGQVTAVLGPNGAGKSTLLRCLCGTLRPDEGRVLFDGAPVERLAARELALRRAVLTQENRLAFAFEAAGVAGMGRIPHAGRSTRHEDVQAIGAAMDATGTTELATRDFTTLSGGEKQRVHLARALCQLWPLDGDRKLLLLDEPTNNLDLAHQHGVLRTARRMAQRGLAVGVVLHDPNLAAMYADRVAVLSAGSIVADGVTAQTLTPDLLSEVYGIRLSGVTGDGATLLFPAPE